MAEWFPQDCVLCGDRAPSLVCSACTNDLPVAPAGCALCAAASTDGEICGDCLRELPQFDTTLSAFRYDFPLDRLIHAYKFNANLALTSLFAAALAARARIRGNAMPGVIVPVPLAKKRLAERGFNQSALIASQVAATLGVSCESFHLLKTRETVPQVGLDREARRKNVKGAFACNVSLNGQTVAIVDDVMTTGATLSEAARVLKVQGAARVEAWVIARADRLR